MPDYVVIRLTKEQAHQIVSVLHSANLHKIKDIVKTALRTQKSPMKERLIQNDKKK